MKAISNGYIKGSLSRYNGRMEECRREMSNEVELLDTREKGIGVKVWWCGLCKI